MKGRLSSSKIVEAARASIETHGASSFSIRTLASALEVSPMALYRHTGDRSRLLGLVVDLVLSEHVNRLEANQEEVSFQTLARSYGALVMRNPQVFIAYIGDQNAKSAEAERLSDRMVAILIEEGQNAQDARIMRDIVVDHAHGYLLATTAHTNPAAVDDLFEGYDLASGFLITRLTQAPLNDRRGL